MVAKADFEQSDGADGADIRFTGRLTLARLLLRDPQIIILDEATSGLDVNMESEIMNMILSLFRSR